MVISVTLYFHDFAILVKTKSLKFRDTASINFLDNNEGCVYIPYCWCLVDVGDPDGDMPLCGL